MLDHILSLETEHVKMTNPAFTLLYETTLGY